MTAGPSSSLTHTERGALQRTLNLADGHSRPDSRDLSGLLERAYNDCFSRPLEELESELLRALLRDHARQSLLQDSRYFFSYSASSATELVAKYLRRHGKTVALLEPCFDNIPEILNYLDVHTVPVRENELPNRFIERNQRGIDAMWIVMPNNPTSWQLRKHDFESLISALAGQRITLILDACFRHYSEIMCSYDQYEVLESSGIDYIVIEDTGKTWASEEIKVGITATSKSLAREFQQLHEALLLRVSPLFLQVISSLVKDANSYKRLTQRLDRNRFIVETSLSTKPVVIHSRNGPKGEWALPLEWLEIKTEATFTARDLTRRLDGYGVQVLHGPAFYWAVPSQGERFIRLALNRDSKTVQDSLALIKRTIEELDR